MARIHFAVLAAFIALFGGGPLTPAQAAEKPQRDIAIEWAPTEPEQEGAMWLAYLMARATFIESHPELYANVQGVVTPQFEEEVEARSAAAQIYRELQQSDATLELAYFTDLLRIADASFMREYVWLALRQPTWTSAPSELRLPEFEDWAKTNLSSHKVVTQGAIRIAGAEQ